MSNAVHCSIDSPIREFVSWNERWLGHDNGLIWCWERGRQLRDKQPDLAERANKGELVILVWRGGVEMKLKGEKFGSWNYLAMWQGLRGENLDIDTEKDVTIVCARTGQEVKFTTEIPPEIEVSRT